MLDREEWDALEAALEEFGFEEILEANDYTLLGLLALLVEDGYLVIPKVDR